MCTKLIRQFIFTINISNEHLAHCLVNCILIYWFDSGAKMREGKLQRGQPIGRWKEFHEDGSLLVEESETGRILYINNDEKLKALVDVEETRYNVNAEIEQHYKYR